MGDIVEVWFSSVKRVIVVYQPWCKTIVIQDSRAFFLGNVSSDSDPEHVRTHHDPKQNEGDESRHVLRVVEIMNRLDR